MQLSQYSKSKFVKLPKCKNVQIKIIASLLTEIIEISNGKDKFFIIFGNIIN